MPLSLIRPPSLLAPVFTRSSIRWRSVAKGVVEIEIDLENPESEPTSPGDLIIETAGLGAFVPFRPVTRVALGSLEPGERRQVRTRVRRESLAVPIAMPSIFGTLMAEVLRHSHQKVQPELIDLMSRSEWAGNLNVYFDRMPASAVEVHRALDLRVRAGTPVAIMVVVPDDREAFDIDIRVSDAGWRANHSEGFVPMSFVVIQPPPGAGLRGSVTIDVTRRSDGRMVPVELTFETVDGSGDALGCIAAASIPRAVHAAASPPLESESAPWRTDSGSAFLRVLEGRQLRMTNWSESSGRLWQSIRKDPGRTVRRCGSSCVSWALRAVRWKPLRFSERSLAPRSNRRRGPRSRLELGRSWRGWVITGARAQLICAGSPWNQSDRRLGISCTTTWATA